MLDILDFLGWCFIPLLVCTGGLLAIIVGHLPLLSEKSPVLSGWPARAYGLMLFMQLPVATWVVAIKPEMKWKIVIAANLMAFLTGGALFALVRHLKQKKPMDLPGS